MANGRERRLLLAWHPDGDISSEVREQLVRLERSHVEVCVNMSMKPIWLRAWVPEDESRTEAMEHVIGTRAGVLSLVWIP